MKNSTENKIPVFGRGFPFPLVMVTLICLWGCREKDDRRVYFSNLVEGTKVHSPLRLEMKAENLVIQPGHKGVTKGHGHFQILVEPRQGIPNARASEFRLNFTEGQKEAIVNLPKGEYDLTLLFVQGNNISLNPPIYQKIGVNVVAEKNRDEDEITITGVPSDSLVLADSTQRSE